MNPLVSIIVPIYNNSSTIGRCIDSLLAQTYKNIEIILINDGSTDKSCEEICLEYTKKPLIKYFHKDNEGPAQARNYGISKISNQSKYISFCDSDDTYEEDFVEILMKSIGDAMLSMCQMNHIYDEKNNFIHIKNDFKAITYKSPKNNTNFLNLLKTGIVNSPCNKLYRTDLIKQLDLRFKKMIICEDIDFNLRYIFQLNQPIVVVDKKLYNYWHYSGSETSKSSVDVYENYMTIHKFLLENTSSTYYPSISEFVFPQYLANSIKLLKNHQDKEVKEYLNKPLIKQSFDDHKYYSWKEKLLVKLIQKGLFQTYRLIFG